MTPSGTPIVTFTSWSAVKPGSTDLFGASQEAAYEYPASAITKIGVPSESENYRATLTFDDTMTLTRLVLGTDESFEAFYGLALDSDPATPPEFLVATGRNSQGTSVTRKAVISNPLGEQWGYQSFGVWETGVDTNNGTLGVFSVGAPTPAGDVPGVDGASFTGKVVGSYVNAAGQGHTVLADLGVDVSWADRSLAFATTNTRIAADGISFYTNPDPDLDLNLSGTLVYDPTNNRFSGVLTTTQTPTATTRTLAGDSTGQFYGPNAEELGGVFFLKAATGVESYRGAYGAQVTP